MGTQVKRVGLGEERLREGERGGVGRGREGAGDGEGAGVGRGREGAGGATGEGGAVEAEGDEQGGDDIVAGGETELGSAEIGRAHV